MHRLFVPMFYDAQNTYALSSDGDMWNLDRAHFHTRSPTHDVQLFYANAYPRRSDTDAPMYPVRDASSAPRFFVADDLSLSKRFAILAPSRTSGSR